MKRPRYPIPDFVRDALAARKLIAAYDVRPPYQRNDYIGWSRCWKNWRRGMYI